MQAEQDRAGSRSDPASLFRTCFTGGATAPPVDDRLSADFSEVLEDVFLFADPALGNRVADSIWIPDGGWMAR